MKKTIIILSFIILQSCKVNYSLSGINIGKDVKTFQVDYFPNNASLIVPGINDDLRNMLVDKISQTTNLEQVKENGDLVYEGEITDYDIQPVALTSEDTASKNRLTIKVKINYTNSKKEKDNFTKTYSYHYDFPANQNPTEIQNEAHKDIFEQILNNIFNDTLAKW